MRKLEEYEKYCPICGRVLTASNIEEVRNGEHESYIFVHDDIPHEDGDIEALKQGVQ